MKTQKIEIGKKYLVENIKTGKIFKATVKDVEGSTISFKTGVIIDAEKYKLYPTF